MEDVKEPCENSNKDVANSSSSKDRSMTLPEEAFNNFLQGKRHMLVQDYSFAVQSLATACEMYVKHYGELAIECGEVYFLYGKALFRLSQQQAGVLGGAINEGSNEDENSSESEGKENEENESEKNSDAEEGEENEETEPDGEKEENEETEPDGEKEEKEPSESTDSPPAVLDEGSAEGKVKEETSKSVDEAGPSQQEQSVKSESGDKVSEENKTDSSEENQEPEEDDLELAWNTLETAKSIFKRLDTVEAELKVAEILQLLAEISMESDNNPAAINDLKESLKIQKKHLKPDDRILAETYYQMGLAQMLEKVYPEALENFRTTKQILELRRENLKNTKVDDADGTFKSADIQAEIADLDTILVDIQEKIEDTLELITNKEKEMVESVFVAGSSSISIKEVGEKSTVSKPVSNITHLLKRKKPEDASSSSEDGAKRIKTTNVPNGESKVSESETKAAEL